MTILIERNTSRATSRGQNSWEETREFVADTGDAKTAVDAAAEDYALVAGTTDKYSGLGAVPGAAHPNASDYPGAYCLRVDAERIAPDACGVTVVYGNFLDPNNDENNEVWEWGMETEEVTITSVESPSYQANYWNQSGTVTTQFDETAISRDTDGNVLGVPVLRPLITLTVKKQYTSEPSQSFRLTIADTIGKVNSSSFAGFSSGEVLLVGAPIIKVAPSLWEIQFRFRIGKSTGLNTVTNYRGYSINFTSPKGMQDYIWYGMALTRDSGKMTSGIKSVHVAQVYDDTSFSSLGIGS